MNPAILQSTISDLAMVLDLFHRAIQFQKENNYIGWQHIDKEFIENDIRQGHLYKVVDEEKLFAIFCVCYNDQLIWREKDKGDAIYLHRIVLNRQYAGLKIFRTILDWAIEHARKMKLAYIRMDTWATNTKLINYYKGYGFRFIENCTTEDTPHLPIQNRNLNVALLEFDIS